MIVVLAGAYAAINRDAQVLSVRIVKTVPETGVVLNVGATYPVAVI